MPIVLFVPHCPPHKHTDVKACTNYSKSCVTSVLLDYTVAMLPAVRRLFRAQEIKPLGTFHPYVEMQKGRKLRGTEAREHGMRMSHPKETSDVYL